MRKFIIVLSILATVKLQAQNVGIGTNSPASSAQLDISSTTRGLLPPRMTAVQRNAITSPANGLMVYDTDSAALMIRSAGIWNKLSSTALGDLWRSNGGNDIFNGNAGNVGIGVNAPLFKLDLLGRMLIRGDGNILNSPGVVFTNPAGTIYNGLVGTQSDSLIGFFGSGNNMPNNGWGLNMNIYNGRVGIGTNNSKAALHVADSNVLFSGGSSTVPLSGPYPDPAAEGPGRRMLWYPGKAAFRVGYAITEWDKDSIGRFSFAAGWRTIAREGTCTAFGEATRAYEGASTALGSNTLASGYASLSAGFASQATEYAATATGFLTNATGLYSTAMGYMTVAGGITSTAMGYETKATNNDAFSVNRMTVASGSASFAAGTGSKAKAVSSAVFGRYNDSTDTPNSVSPSPGDRLFQIGNGTADNARRNALTILRNGNMGIGTIKPSALMHIAGISSRAVPALWLNAGDQFNQTTLKLSSPTVPGYSWQIVSTVNPDVNDFSNYFSISRLVDSAAGLIIPPFVINKDGYVGIGTYAPIAPLSFPPFTGKKISLFPGNTGDAGFGVFSNELRQYVDDQNGAITFGFDNSTTGFTERFRMTPTGNLRFASDQQSIQFVSGSGTSNKPMVSMFESGVTNPARMVIAHSPGFSDWGLEYEDAPDKFHFRNTVEKRLTIALPQTSNGILGIGNATPNAPLQFANDIRNRKLVLYETANNDHQFYGFGVTSSVLRYQTATTGDDHVFYAGTSTTNSQELMRLKGTGFLGIGNSPEFRLDVSGRMRVRSGGDANNSAGIVFNNNNNSALQSFLGARADDEFGVYGYTGTAGWRFYINTTTGNAFLQGGLTQNSDARLKKDIVPLSNSLEAIQQLSGYSYHWKDASNPDEQIGLLAQEVQQVYPELVKENSDGKLGVNYAGMVPVLLQAIKEQQQQIEIQNKRIAELEKKLK